MTAGFMLAGAVTLLALPSAVLAFSTGFEPDDRPETTSSDIDGFARAEEAPLRLARAIPMRSLGHEQPFPFTPAKTPVRPDRSVTVAIRVDPETAKSIQVRGPKPKIADNGASPLRIAPTAFSLGVSRGYHNFAQDLVPPTREVVVDGSARRRAVGEDVVDARRPRPPLPDQERGRGDHPLTRGGHRVLWNIT